MFIRNYSRENIILEDDYQEALKVKFVAVVNTIEDVPLSVTVEPFKFIVLTLELFDWMFPAEMA